MQTHPPSHTQELAIRKFLKKVGVGSHRFLDGALAEWERKNATKAAPLAVRMVVEVEQLDMRQEFVTTIGEPHSS